MTENELIKKAVEFHREFEILQKEAECCWLSLDFCNLTDFIYENRGTDVSWNKEGNKEDLEYGDGETYCVELNYVIYEDDEFLLVEADDWCEALFRNYLFSKAKEVVYE